MPPPRSRGAVLAAGALALASCSTGRPLVATRPSAAPPSTAPGPATPPGGRFGLERDVSLAPVEAAAVNVARGRLSRAGAPAKLSAALVLAARDLARRAAAGDREPLSQAARRAALSRGLAYDPAPAAFLVHGPADRLAAALAEVIPPGVATHLGAGAVESGGGAWVVVLASERKVRLDPFPREVAVGGEAIVSGSLSAGLLHPRVFLTAPSGAVAELPGGGGRGAFRARIAFPEAGRYAIEVVAQGEGGPEVAALLDAHAGPSPSPSDRPAGAARRSDPEPEDAAAAEAGVLRALNALRGRRGLAPLQPAPEVQAVARAHSAAMRAQGSVAHLLPGSGELVDRLRQAGVAYRRAYENVARAGTALAAHQAAEESPAHLGNMLQPAATRVGLGIARGRLPSGDAIVYLTEILVEPPDDGAESPLTPEARVKEALWRERARLGRPPLTSDVSLDGLAREAAEAMRARDATEPGDADRRALGLGRSLAAVDVFVASAPDEAIRSANLRDRRFTRVGVGATTGDSRRFGAGRLFVVVVYTD